MLAFQKIQIVEGTMAGSFSFKMIRDILDPATIIFLD